MKNWEAKLLRFALKNNMNHSGKNEDRIALYSQKWIYTLNLFDGFRGNSSLMCGSGSGNGEEGVHLQILTGLRCMGLEIIIKTGEYRGRNFLLIKNREVRRSRILANSQPGSPWQYQFFTEEDTFSESFVMTLLNGILFRFIH
jgi:hypothetical protein